MRSSKNLKISEDLHIQPSAFDLSACDPLLPMESFHFGGVHKTKRAVKSDENLFHLRKIAKLFRAMELFVVLVLISRFSVELPEAVKNSGEYFKALKLMVLSPRFVFVLGNLIVITLFAKSGQFSGKDSALKNDFYSEFIEKSDCLNHGARLLVESGSHEKEVILEKAAPSKAFNGSPPSGAIKTAYRRSRSEKLNHGPDERPNYELRRSATEKCMNRSGCSEKLSIEDPFLEDSMSNDDFRRTVEAFIARQQSFLRDEERSVL